jgi:hypothetical protein
MQLYQGGVGRSATSECSWYFVIYSVDSTIGMALVLIAHEACLKIARARVTADYQQHEVDGTDLEILNSDASVHANRATQGCSTAFSQRERKSHEWVFEYIADCGDYGNPPNFWKWAVQV